MKHLLCSIFIILLTVKLACANTKSYKVGIIKSDIVSEFVFQKIAIALSIDFEFYYYDDYSEILSLLMSKELDLTADITYSLERDTFLDFSAPISIDSSYIFTKSKYYKSEINNLLIPSGSIYRNSLKSSFINTHIDTYKDISDVFRYLEQGRSDAFIGNISMLEIALERGLKAEKISRLFDVTPVAIATKSGNNLEIIHDIDNLLSKNNLQDQIYNFVNQYEHDIRVKVLQEKIMKSGVDINQVITFKVEDLQADGIAPSDGLSFSIVKRACVILGFRCQLVNGADESWLDIYSDLEQNSIDMLAAMIITDNRQKQFFFSEPYYKPKIFLVSRLGYKTDQYQQLSELVGERIGVIKGDFFQKLIGERLPHKPVYEFSSQDKMVEALLNGVVDYIPLGEGNFNKIMTKERKILPISHVKSISAEINNGTAIAFQGSELGRKYAMLFSEALPLVDVKSIVNAHGSQPDWKSFLLAEKKYIRLTQALFVSVVIFLILFSYSLYIQTSTDSLSKLGSRRALTRRFKFGVKREYVFVYMDINNFKLINDNYGHYIGDLVLVAFAQNIKRHWPGKAYRIGGDEFVLTLNNTKADVSGAFNRLQLFNFKVKDTGENIAVSVSAGISVQREGTISLQALLRDIDRKMYADKTEKI